MKPTRARVLACPMQDNDAEASTIGEYLAALLHELWQEGESFNGKRPFGNSGWECDLFEALVRAGLVDGQFDEDDYLGVFDEEAAIRLVHKAIDALTDTSS